MAGKLFVVATPLGNLGDISQRALDTLRRVEMIACEDTRRTSRLLAAYEIRTPLLSCHRFNEQARLAGILDRLGRGDDVALVSDGGTPVVSDPGGELIRAAVDAGVAVVPIPGGSAVTALLSIAGLSADRFVFDGFLPHRGGERRRRLRELRDETRPVVVFESPRRIVATLEDVDRVLGRRPLVLGRELTKVHETVLRGTALELIAALDRPVRGELTLLIAGTRPGDTPAAERDADALRRAWGEALAGAGGDRRKALKDAARALGLRRAELHRRLVELGESV
ncbi:MAG TPA: 16S rRNA (cytidine(1402)-2'-O)-methyltransferase [Candidatus Polarisedimenticolaceae bacterium]|nr:16S rRNA (cytidine(1402)-2'-O)-methyltransferase [Candidatus Polarisedimenticolaceae bacterium]